MRTRFLLAATGALAPLTAQRVPELEPNDTPAQAQSLTASRHVEANLAAGEQDWFAFTLANAAQVHLRTSGNFAVNPSVDTYVAIYDAAGATRLAWDDNSAGVHSDCGVTLDPGSYTVLVMGKTTTTAGDYGLDFVVLPVAQIGVAEGAEPNGDPALGGTPTPITPGDTVIGELTSTSDVDWFTFTLTGRAVVQAICYDDGGVPQLDNTRLAFYQETSPGVFAAFGTSSFISTSHRAFNLAHPTTLAAGTYAIEVSSATSTATGTAPWDYTKVGKYSLRTRRIDLPGTNTVAEAPEPNNTPTTAAFLALGDQATGNCSGMNEGDWYGFGVGAPTTIVAMSDNFGATPITDTTVSLFDADGNQIASASSGGPNSHGRLITTINTPGIYYIQVSGGLFAATGDYVLYTGGVDPMFVASAANVQPASTNACPGSNTLRPLLGFASGEAPVLGSTFVSRVDRTLPNTIIVPMLGLSNTTAFGGAISLPFDLGLIGAPGCFVRVDPLVTIAVLADANGTAFFDFPLVPNLAARGFTVYAQALCLDPPLNAAGLSVSNDMRLIVGDRSF